MTVALRTTGVAESGLRRDPMERFREIRVSSVSYRAKGPMHSKLQQYNYEIHPGARDHSHTCATTKYMHRRLARQTRTRKARQKQSGRDRARPLRAHAPDPGADRTRVPRCPRRCARCSWTPRCARALTCDRAASRSASSRRARVEWVCKGRAAHTCSSTMPMWYSAPQASRGSADPLEPA